MSVKIGKLELSILEMIFLLIFVLGFLIFYGTMVSNPDEFSMLTVISIILIVVGFILFFLMSYKKCYVPETAPMKQFEDMAQTLESQQLSTTPNPIRPTIKEEVKAGTTKPKSELFEEDLGEETLEGL